MRRARGVIASNDAAITERVRTLTEDPEIIELGLAAARVFPELPTVAVDIIRERDTNVLRVLEVNPKGESWHLSSRYAEQTYSPEHRAALYAQRNALRVVAETLIEKTRTDAA